ncbi:MAG: RDD family protein [bacterium]
MTSVLGLAVVHMGHFAGARRALLVPAFAVTLTCVTGAPRASADLPGTIRTSAAADGHLWWVVERAPPGESGQASGAAQPFLLMHHAAVEPAPTERLVTRLAREPEALAAEGTTLVVVSPSEGQQLRMVLALRARRNEVTGLWFTEPRGGPQILPPLPAAGQLRSFALSGGRAYALLREAASGPEASQPVHRLLSLEVEGGAAWNEVALPPLDLAENVRLSDADGRLRGVGSIGEDAHESMLGVTAEAPSWSEPTAIVGIDEARLSARRALGVIELDSVSALVERVPPVVDGGPATIRLAVLRDGRTNGWASFPEPSVPWAVAGFGGEAMLFSLDKERRGVERRIAPSAATPGEPTPLSPPGFTSRNWIHIPILGILSVALALAAVIFGADAYLENRPQQGGNRAPSAPIPADRRRGARLGERAAAASFDMAPGFLVAWILFPGSMVSMMQFPIFVADASIGAPAFTAFAIGWAFGAVGDVVFGRSLGKRIVGLEIIGVRGDSVSAGRRLLRSLAALITVASPPVMLIAALNPRGDGPAEMVSGTAVVPVAAEGEVGGREGSGSDERDPT